ncbi:hypothetical protein H6F77_08045 [Microcoleus sp. FACHB-831]|uniref:hypothetical protein n=1 Tax=Microcoleus sp. FACHB-831 TaxID=2692827 RepID=UPI001687914B|nr:hypothetical protein [Microcoleus sp. FACHB-831]MBD1921039.1 hypothetical protein [Microcoleus sp. FACHB-831]
MSSEAFMEYGDYSSLENVAIALHDTIRLAKMLYYLFILDGHLPIWATLGLMPHPHPCVNEIPSLKAASPSPIAQKVVNSLP